MRGLGVTGRAATCRNCCLTSSCDTPMSPAAISTCCSWSEDRSCAARTASSIVGGSFRTRSGSASLGACWRVWRLIISAPVSIAGQGSEVNLSAHCPSTHGRAAGRDARARRWATLAPEAVHANGLKSSTATGKEATRTRALRTRVRRKARSGTDYSAGCIVCCAWGCGKPWSAAVRRRARKL